MRRHSKSIFACVRVSETEPHEITHAPDALRGFAIFHTRPNEDGGHKKKSYWSADMWEDFYSASEEEQNYLKSKYGEPQ